MASFSKGTSFTDGVTGDVTAAKLHALVDAATPVDGLILDRTNETVIGTDDVIMISDTSESGALNKMTVANLMKAELTGTINSTAGTITAATIPTLTAGTTTGTAATFTSGTITTLNSTTGTISTGVIPTLTSTTLITSGTGTAAAPAIVPTGDTNTGVFFPAADTAAFSTQGTERLRITNDGYIGIGTNNPARLVTIDHPTAPQLGFYTSGTERVLLSTGGSATSQLCIDTGGSERLRIDSSGNVGVGTASPTNNIGWTTLALNSSTNGGLLELQKNGTRTFLLFNPSGSSDTTIQAETSNNLRLGAGGTERLRIDSSGFVSIGTATALSALHVHGNVTLSNTTTATSAGTGGLSKPATYAGYLTVSINGTSRKIPYYAT